VFGRKIEGLVNKYIETGQRVPITEEIEHLHALVFPPALALFRLCEGFGVDRHGRTVADVGESLECLTDIIGIEGDHEVNVHGQADIAVSIDCKTTRDQVAYLGLIKCLGDGFEGSEFHGCSCSAAEARQSARRTRVSSQARRKGPCS